MNQVHILIIIATVLFSMKGFSDSVFFNRYKFQVQEILNGDKLRMLTSGFLHADWAHLGFNMYALYLFGKVVLFNFGPVLFIVIYVASLLGGSIYSLFTHKKNSYYSAIGASGAVSGILFSSILLNPSMKLMMLPIPIPMPAYVFGIGYLLYSIYGMKKQVGNVGHSAHLGGAVCGFVATLLFRPEIITNHFLLVSILGIIIAGMFIFGDKLKVN